MSETVGPQPATEMGRQLIDKNGQGAADKMLTPGTDLFDQLDF